MSEEDPPVSPFQKLTDLSLVLYESDSIMPVNGEYKLLGYSLPGYELCLYWPQFSCEWDWYGWRNWAVSVKCKTDWTNWCCCWGIAEIPVFPDIIFSVQGNIPIKLKVILEGFTLPKFTPPEPIITQLVIIEPFSLALSVNNLKFGLICLEEPYDVGSDEELQFETSITLPSWEYEICEIGFCYYVRLYLDLEFDLLPSPGSSYIKIPLNCDFKVTDEFTGSKICSYSFNWNANIVTT